MANIILVHGAWHGGWCYRDTARLLRAQGHTVLTPTHTGVGERAHQSGEATGCPAGSGHWSTSMRSCRSTASR